MRSCIRCGHAIIEKDIEIGVASKDYHKERLCRTLDFIYGSRKKWRLRDD